MDHARLSEVVDSYLTPYFARNGTAAKALEAVKGIGTGPDKAKDSTRAAHRRDVINHVHWDHFAFRTFDSDGCGIDSIAKVFTDLGYVRRDELRFEQKKLIAYWFAPPPPPPPPPPSQRDTTAAAAATHPRVFISNLLVDDLSPAAAAVVRKYTAAAAAAEPAAISAAAREGRPPWPCPTLEDYRLLAAESEYAAWTLVNGYGLNHVAISVHRLARRRGGGGGNVGGESGGSGGGAGLESWRLEDVNALLTSPPHNLSLNTEGGVVKVSPDGLLRQSSTVADVHDAAFACGGEARVPGSYIEFAERLPLPQYAAEVEAGVVLREDQRRDGFEVGNADKIFESTFAGQTGADERKSTPSQDRGDGEQKEAGSVVAAAAAAAAPR